MKNYVQPGDIVTVTAPAAIVSGAGLLIGSLFGVATASTAAGAPLEIKTTGVFELDAADTGAAAIGTPVSWDAASGRITTGDGVLIGVLVAAKAASAATATVRLNGISLTV